MSKKKTRSPVRPVHISQPLNFRHEGHIGPVNAPHHTLGRRENDVDHTPPGQITLPQPCPGPSIVQNIGTQALDQTTIEVITRRVKDAIKEELLPLKETLEEALYQNEPVPIYPAKHCGNTTVPQRYVNSSSSEGFATELATTETHLHTSKQPSEQTESLSLANPTYSPVQNARSFKKKRPVPSPRPSLYRTLPGRLRCKQPPNQRDCYARALKLHIEDIVANTIFDASYLPDILISGECLTEDECRTIREKVDRKDQVRILVAVIRTRDLAILEKFLTYLGEQNAHLKRKIEDTIDKYKKDGFKESKCILCKMKDHISVKYVSDRLWAEGCIQDDVYSQIIYSEKPVGAQNKLWEAVLENFAKDRNTRHAFHVLEDFIRTKGHYEYIADGIKAVLSREGERFTCECTLHVRFSKILSISTAASIEPLSSGSSVAASSKEIFSDEISGKSTDSLKENEFTDTLTEQRDEEETLATSNEPGSGTPIYDNPPPLPKKKMLGVEGLSSTEDSSYV